MTAPHESPCLSTKPVLRRSRTSVELRGRCHSLSHSPRTPFRSVRPRYAVHEGSTRSSGHRSATMRAENRNRIRLARHNAEKSRSRLRPELAEPFRRRPSRVQGWATQPPRKRCAGHRRELASQHPDGDHEVSGSSVPVLPEASSTGPPDDARRRLTHVHTTCRGVSSRGAISSFPTRKACCVCLSPVPDRGRGSGVGRSR
jgi:hypothetical protein